MLKCHENFFYTLWIVFTILCLFLSSCDNGNSATDPTADKQVDIAGLPADPGPGNLAGNITGAINKQPIAGVTVSVRTRSVTTDSNGVFRLDNIGEGNLALIISGEQIYTRTAAVNTANGRSIQLDVIEKESDFNLDFYRELARGNHPQERELLPIHRWDNPIPPTFYIDTNAAATFDEVVTQSTIETTRRVIAQVLPVFSGNLYSTPSIQIRQFSQYNFDAIPDNSIVISYDDTLYLQGAMGVTFTEPDFTAATTDLIQKAWIFVLNKDEYYFAGGISREEMAAHELGHAFGYRHTSLLPSVMVKFGAYGGLFSEYDRLHMTLVYSRPAGNVDIDNDPLPGAKMIDHIPKRHVFIDQRANFSQPAEAIQHLQLLRSLTDEFFRSRPRSAFK